MASTAPVTDSYAAIASVPLALLAFVPCYVLPGLALALNLAALGCAVVGFIQTRQPPLVGADGSLIEPSPVRRGGRPWAVTGLVLSAISWLILGLLIGSCGSSGGFH